MIFSYWLSNERYKVNKINFNFIASFYFNCGFRQQCVDTVLVSTHCFLPFILSVVTLYSYHQVIINDNSWVRVRFALKSCPIL